MTRLPTPISIRHLLDSLDALHRRPTNRRIPDPTVYAFIERGLARMVQRDATGTTDRDGYPSTTLGGYGGTGDSTVEAHALALPERDRHHELTALACTHLEQAVHSLQIVVSAIHSADDLVSDQGPTPRTCAACTGHRPLSGDRSDVSRGTVGDRLERAVDLCRACMDYVRTTAPAGTHAGHMPTPEQIRWHDTHGRWKLRLTSPSQISNVG